MTPSLSVPATGHRAELAPLLAAAAAALGTPVTSERVIARYHLPYEVVLLDADVAGERQRLILADAPTGPLIARYPHDPALPELAELLDREGARLIAYRPTRRAVIALGSTAYAKLAAPARIARLIRAHDLLAAAGLPVAPLLERREGCVVMAKLAGTPLTTLLAAVGGSATYRQVHTLLDRLPAAATGLPRRRAWCERIATHAELAARLVPDARIESIADVVAAEVAAAAPGPLVPTHGDLYEANVLTDGRAITGLLDVDTLGPGYRIDDIACLLGHLAAVRRYRDEPAYRRSVDELFAAASADHDEERLARRTAGILLTLVPGALRASRRERADQLDLADHRITTAAAFARGGPAGGRHDRA